MEKDGFLNERRILLGPWQAFERDVARLLIANNFNDVRIVGGKGDRGGDILGVKNEKIWVIQCKHTTTSHPPSKAICEAVNAAAYYGANEIAVAVSRPPSDSFNDEKLLYEKQGLKIRVLTPKRLLINMRSTPEYSKLKKNLRDYQQEIAVKLRESFLDTGRAQLIMATGLGKTIVMAEVISELLKDDLIKNNRVLVIAHTRAIVKQLHQHFWYQLPKWVPTHQLAEGEVPTYWDGITFATIQSVLSKIDQVPKFGMVLIDEAHHVGADIFLRSIKELDPPMIGGVTATPWRGDCYDIDRVLGSPIARVGIAEGLKQGFLSEVDYRLMADDLNWTFIQEASNYNYSVSQLNKKLIIPKRDDECARLIREAFDKEKRNQGIVFSPTIEHANSFSAYLRQYGLKAEAISSHLPEREQDIIMSQFKAGKYDFVITVDLFNEGVDVPDVDIIVFMRATHSRRIFVQQLGRGLRISPNKDKVVVLDFVTDLRRIAEVIRLDYDVRSGHVERLGLGKSLIQFKDVTARDFLSEWMLDQADHALREGDPKLEIPKFEFPKPHEPGNIQ